MQTNHPSNMYVRFNHNSDNCPFLSFYSSSRINLNLQYEKFFTFLYFFSSPR